MSHLKNTVKLKLNSRIIFKVMQIYVPNQPKQKKTWDNYINTPIQHCNRRVSCKRF